MVFSSLIFLFSFLPFLLIGNYLWRNRNWQNLLLFIGSLYFYAWGEGERVLVMIASIIINYYIGRGIGAASRVRKRKNYLALGVFINLAILVYFKYFYFIIQNINELIAYLGFHFEIYAKNERLPIGISFYTFQSISYLIDVFRNENKAQKNFINVGLYIALFPQLIAGPIVRYHDISNQLRNRTGNISMFSEGVRRFIIGFGKKVLIANTMAEVVDQIFALEQSEMTTSLAWVAVLAYGLQLYFDFSGYSDMAIGLGKMFGFNILENFNFPYISRSIREFWRRWHISLSNWFMDYLYIPLGGNRNGGWRTYRNLLIVFFLTGLWHGANWNFVVFGLFHGFFMIFERMGFDRWLDKSGPVVPHIYTLLVVHVSWVFFRIEDFSYGLTVLKCMFGFASSEQAYYTVEIFTHSFFWTLFGIGVVLSTPWLAKTSLFQGTSRSPAVRFATVCSFMMILFLSVINLVNTTYNPFIYFRF